MSLRGDWLLHKARKENLKASVAASFKNPSRRGDELAAVKFPDPKKVHVTQATNYRLVTLEPDGSTTRHVVLLHGGAYRVRGFDSHRHWMVALASERGVRVTYIDYPLSPEATVRDTVPVTEAAYEKILAEFPNDQVVLLGDSAGGGLALVLLEHLRDNALPMPVGSVLVSPWSDLEMSDLALEKRAAKDPELPFDVMKEVAQDYAGDVPLNNLHVSPIFGDLTNLGKIGLFYGSTELLVPDHQQLSAELRHAEGTEVDVFELKNMMHDYLLWSSLPESKRTFDYLMSLF